ncbi:MAG: cell division protein FtsA [Candidatus Wildermuthbacteria bacterium]|nr:cell division protein FtsA [Candidatus Wildermuthbacteria bacterium]
MKLHSIAALDLGTHSLKMVVARQNEGGEFEIVAAAQEPSSGVRKGTIVNPDEVAKKIGILMGKVESMASLPITEFVVNIGGGHIFITPSHGIVAVSRADGNVSQEDVERVLQAAQALSLESNKEVLDVIPKEFIVDGTGGLREVVGMKGVRLEVNVLALCAFSPYMKHLSDAVLSSGVGIADMVVSPLADAAAVLSPRQKEVGAAVIDIGAGTTGLAVFEEGDLIHTSVLPVGSENITNDIAIGLRVDPALAERIKLEYGILASKGKKIQKIALDNGTHFSFSQKLLSHIIEARINEIFQCIQRELKQVERQEKLPAGIILTGGGAKLPSLADFARKELKLSTKVGLPSGIVGFPEDPAFAVALGLLYRGIELQEYAPRTFLEDNPFLQRIKKVFRLFIP